MSTIDATKDMTVRKAIKRGDHHSRMQRLRDQERQRRSTIMGLLMVATGIACLALIGIADFNFEWNLLTRLAAMACAISAVVTTAVVMRGWLRFEAMDAVCEAEQAWPEIGQRLRTSHDYQSYPDHVSAADPVLLAALEEQTAEQVVQHPVKPLGQSWPIAVLAGCCLAVGMVWFAAFVLSPEWRIANARLLMLPIHYSTVVLEPIPDLIEQGDDLQVRLHVTGRPIESAIVQYRSGPAQDWQVLPMTSQDDASLVGELTANLSDCRQDMQLQVIADPLEDPVHSIAVRLPLHVDQWDVEVQPPAYTGVHAFESAAADARIPAGSKIALTARFNREPATMELQFSPSETACGAVAIADQLASSEIEAGQEPIDIHATASAADGARHESALLLNVIPDRPPVIKFLSPREDSEAIATAELRFTVEAYDDYAIHSLELRYRIDDGPEMTLWQSTEDDVGSALSQSIVLALEDLDVSYPQSISYYAVASDNRADQGQRITSDLRFVDIRPFSRDYEFSDGQCNCQGECLTLETLIKQQRELLGQTFAIVQQSQADQESSSAVGPLLAKRQHELLEQTTTLAQAIEQKIGPVIELDTAIDWMTDAVEDLERSDFQAGQHTEEKSLASLIAARRNLRVILKQGNAQSQQVRNIDQLRLDQVKKPQQAARKNEPATLSELREQLEQLAQRQENFCESAQTSKAASGSAAASGETSSSNISQWAQAQQESEQRARQIQGELADGKFGELAIKRSEQAAQAIAKSAQALAANAVDEESDPDTHDPSIDQAVAQAIAAARELRALSEHLGQRHLPDFDNKLATAQRNAERLSEDQTVLNHSLATAPSNESLIGQDALQRRAEELDDLVKQLVAESSEQDRTVQDSLLRASADNSPRQVVALMASASQAIAAQQSTAAAAAGTKAAEMLQRLAVGLKATQQAMQPARLQEWVDREKQAAALLKELNRATTSGQIALAAAQTQQLTSALQPLAEHDPELAQALQEVGTFHSVSTSLVERVRQIDEVLQRRIQEAILGGVLQQSVGAVPPDYADIVDEYYRALSKDVE